MEYQYRRQRDSVRLERPPEHHADPSARRDPATGREVLSMYTCRTERVSCSRTIGAYLGRQAHAFQNILADFRDCCLGRDCASQLLVAASGTATDQPSCTDRLRTRGDAGDEQD